MLIGVDAGTSIVETIAVDPDVDGRASAGGVGRPEVLTYFGCPYEAKKRSRIPGISSAGTRFGSRPPFAANAWM